MILFFLAGVAVCGVFFALGFLVGYNERAPAVAADSERVTGPAAVPPVVNPPPESTKPFGPLSATVHLAGTYLAELARDPRASRGADRPRRARGRHTTRAEAELALRAKDPVGPFRLSPRARGKMPPTWSKL